MRVRFHPAARLEELDVFERYREQNDELANRFRGELKTFLDRIANAPLQFPKVTERHRRAMLHHFPYQVFSDAAKGDIFIVAIAHAKREPYYWLHRS